MDKRHLSPEATHHWVLICSKTMRKKKAKEKQGLETDSQKKKAGVLQMWEQFVGNVRTCLGKAAVRGGQLHCFQDAATRKKLVALVVEVLSFERQMLENPQSTLSRQGQKLPPTTLSSKGQILCDVTVPLGAGCDCDFQRCAAILQNPQARRCGWMQLLLPDSGDRAEKSAAAWLSQGNACGNKKDTETQGPQKQGSRS